MVGWAAHLGRVRLVDDDIEGRQHGFHRGLVSALEFPINGVVIGTRGGLERYAARL